MILVSIDPGLRGCGCAAWSEAGVLLQAAYVAPAERHEVLAEAVETVAGAVFAWTNAHKGRGGVRRVIECPQTYGGRSARGDANDLISVALVVGALGVQFSAPWRLVRPAEWKGNVVKITKHGTNPIELRCRDKLTADELSRVVLPKRKDLGHNVHDAVGLGLWALGR